MLDPYVRQQIDNAGALRPRVPVTLGLISFFADHGAP
jgi:hypothetical protein